MDNNPQSFWNRNRYQGFFGVENPYFHSDDYGCGPAPANHLNFGVVEPENFNNNRTRRGKKKRKRNNSQFRWQVDSTMPRNKKKKSKPLKEDASIASKSNSSLQNGPDIKPLPAYGSNSSTITTGNQSFLKNAPNTSHQNGATWSNVVQATNVNQQPQAAVVNPWSMTKNDTNHRAVETPTANTQHTFPAYNDFKLAHILYCQLRILNMFAVTDGSELNMKKFCAQFWAMYHEDFFRFEVLKHFVKDADDTDQCVLQFIQTFCGHFLECADNLIICVVDNNEFSATIYNEFVGLLEKLTDMRQHNARKPTDPTSHEMQLFNGNIQGIVDITGRRHALSFGGNMNENIRGSQPSMKEVGQRVIQIRKKIARSGLMVKMPDVAFELCKYYNVSSVKNLMIKGQNGMFVTRETDIPEIMEIVRLQAKVNAFIQAFVTFRNICTLHELELDLCKMEEKDLFEDFNLGPLSRQILVYENFKFPYDKKIAEITTVDVFKGLQRLMNSRDRGGPKFGMEEFLDHFIKDSPFKTPFETGIRIMSIALAIATVGKASGFSHRNLSAYIEEFKYGIIAEVDSYLKKSAIKLFHPEDYRRGGDGGLQVDNSLICQMKNQDFIKALKMMFSTIEDIKQGNRTLEKASRNVLFKQCEQVRAFLKNISQCKLSSRILQLVLCTGVWRALQKDDVTILLEMGFKEAAVEIIEQEAKQQQVGLRKVAESPKSEVKKLIKTCLQKRNTLKFTELVHVENWIVNEAQKEEITSFEGFGHGSFLKFVSTDKELLDLVMSALEIEGGGGGGRGFGNTHALTKEDLKSFLNQCCEKTKNKEELKKLLKLQFHLNEINATLQHIIDQTIEEYEHQRTVTTTTKIMTSPFIFSSGLICESDVEFITSKDTDDRHFYHLACQQIEGMPVLTDIADYTNWKNTYAWKLGSLKQTLKLMSKEKCMEKVCFVQCNGDGHFVKINRTSSTDDFDSAIKSFDSVSAMGALVSVVVSSGRLKDAPLALMVSYVKTMFLHHAKDTDVSNEDATASPLLNFTMECFKLLPFDLLVSVAEKLFLNTLDEVYGANNVPTLLLKVFEKDEKSLSLLHALGYQLAVQEWIMCHEEVIAKSMLVVSERLDVLPPNDSITIGNQNDDSQLTKEDNHDDQVRSIEEDVQDIQVEQKDGDEIVVKEEPSEVLPTIKVEEEDSSEPSGAAIGNDIDMPCEDDITVKDEQIESGEVVEDDEENTPVDEKTERLNYCQNLIEEIREKQFGIGVEFGEKGEAMIQTYREREGRSLDRLSKELYTKDSHFVLELIQNADDNEYLEANLNGESAEKPTVAFIVESDKITVLNNEKGFMEKNIRALCDVGRSTKGIHRKGYIGQKGIGFKSVFRVTDAPKIHSNGFHIEFDASKGPNGYILPDWLESADEFELESISQNNEQYCWRTQIVLPLKPEMQLEKLTSRFHDIDPSLLMFLNRLQNVIIDDRVTGKVKTMSKRVVGENLVELCENGQRSLWFVVSKEVPISIRADVSKTSISVAFPIGLEKQLPQKVFAFLPLRSYGFKYIIQADFEVPSSREDIDKDSPWNQFILNKIPSLVLEAFTCFKNHSHFKGLDGAITFFKFMEHQDHILGIFKRVQGEIMRKLQQEECLPVIHDGNLIVTTGGGLVKEEVVWALPSTVVLSKHDNQAVITSNMLKSYLNLKYIHPELKTKKVSTEVLSALGVSQLSLQQLIEVLKRQVADFQQQQQQQQQDADEMLFPWIGRWMSVVATVLQDECDFSDTTYDQLRSLKMIPLTDGSLVSLNEKVVFFPVVADTFVSKNKQHASHSLMVIEKDLCMVSRSLSSRVDEIESEMVRRFLKELGVKSLTPGDLINDYIIPTFKDGSWKDKNEETVIAYVHYLCEQYHVNPNLYDIAELSTCVVLKTNKGMLKPKDTFIYLTPTYGNQLDLEGQFAACEWTLVSDEYLRFGASKKSQQSLSISPRKWQEFFELISLNYFTTLRNEVKTLHKSDLPLSPWKLQFETWPQTEDDTYVISDLVCPEFERLLASQHAPQLKAFAVALDKHWGKYFAEKDVGRPTCKLASTDGKKLKLEFSSFFLQLRFSPWMMATNSKLSPPFGLYLQRENIVTILADKGVYSSLALTNTDFVQVLGLRTELEFHDFVKEFKQWRVQDEFMTSLNHVTRVYDYLRGEFVRWPKERSEMLQNPFIFLPDSSLNRAPHQFNQDIGNAPVKGRFHRITDACWEDPSGLITKEAGSSSRRILKTFYFAQEHHLKDFFLNELQVERYPKPSEYLNLVYRIAEQTNLPDITSVNKILRLFQVLGSICIAGEMKEMLYEWRVAQRFQDNLKLYQHFHKYQDFAVASEVGDACKVYDKLLPTHHNRFVSLKDRKPILVFNTDMADVFKQVENVDFIFFDDIKRLLEKSLADNQHRYVKQGVDVQLLKILAFFKACELPTLTDLYLPPDINPEQIEIGCYLWQCKLHEATPYVQRYLAYKEEDHYEILKAINFGTYLQNTTFFSAYRFEVVFRLKERRDVTVTQSKMAHVEHSIDENGKGTVYIIKEHAESPEHSDDILREIVKLFVPNNDVKIIEDLFDFMCSLFIESNKDVFMQRRKKISPLANSEVVWGYPKPPEPYVEVVESSDDDDDVMDDISQRKPFDGDRPMTCWPPRNPGGGGHVAKPDSVKQKEQEMREKWAMPEAPKSEMVPGIQRGEQRNRPVPSSPRTAGDNSTTPVNNADSSNRDSGNSKDLRSLNEDKDSKDVPRQSRRSYEDDKDSPRHRNGANNEKIGSNDSSTNRTDERHSNQHVGESPHLRTNNGSPNEDVGGKSKQNNKDDQLKEEKSENVPEHFIEEKKMRTSSFRDIPGTPPRGIGAPSNGTPKGTPSKFNVDQLPVYTLSAEYKDIYYELPEDLEKRVTDTDTSNAGVMDDETLLAVGKLGEEIVYSHFCMEYKEAIQSGLIEVRWMNNEVETGEPYDFVINTYDDQGDKGHVLTSTIYIEVKTTLINEEKQFEISSQQLKFALEHGPNFYLYRVSGLAHHAEFRLRCLENLSHYMDKKAVKMYMVL